MDILDSNRKLREMPFSVPDGYFSQLKDKAVSGIHDDSGLTGTGVPEKTVHRKSIWQRVAPYASMAAMFVAIAFAGKAVMKTVYSTTADTDEEDTGFFYSELMPETCSIYDTEDYVAENEGLSEDEIIEYLIYAGISAETINNPYYE